MEDEKLPKVLDHVLKEFESRLGIEQTLPCCDVSDCREVYEKSHCIEYDGKRMCVTYVPGSLPNSKGGVKVQRPCGEIITGFYDITKLGMLPVKIDKTIGDIRKYSFK